jgi:hypothetical protein
MLHQNMPGAGGRIAEVAKGKLADAILAAIEVSGRRFIPRFDKEIEIIQAIISGTHGDAE